MLKTLRLAVLLFPAFALAQSFPSPQIVAKATLSNQSAQIAQKTIVTIKRIGLYRLSVYGAITTANQNSQSAWEVNLFWTDASNTPQSSPGVLSGVGSRPGQFFNLNTMGSPNYSVGFVAVFQANAGTPIMYSVAQNGAPDESIYSLYYTLEQLE